MSDTFSPDRAAADRPVPKAGILDIRAYVPGKATVDGIEHPLKLSANENILGCSPRAKAAYAAAIDQLHVYPDSRATRLREAIANEFRLEPERLIFGCGSDEIFHMLCQVYLEPGDNIVQGEFAFGAYAIGARACQAEVRNAPEPDYRVDVDELLKLVDARTRLVFIANPGNPTGTHVVGSEIRRLQAALPASVVLVLDGAYAEFVEDPAFEDGTDLARTADNVIVTRTFSKLHGLATLRVGWAYGPADMIAALDRIRQPFNTTIPGQAAAIEALADKDFQRASLELVGRWRAWLTQQLGGMGLAPVPSATNFVLVGFPSQGAKTAAAAEDFLARRGLIVRGVGGYGLPDHLRLTIGLEEHNRAVIDALSDFMRA
ncbi:histidinol-phosphate transaminase [Phenylobacterium sp.]|uniref:histidinol-phosphate transaminase n=1 Tax=Phenylobacterium sp. TaxID=1871053 RepID=UPI002FD98A26